MEVIDIIKDYWPQIIGYSFFSSWLGVLSYRVLVLERRDPVVTIAACGRQQADCQKIMALQFASGTKEFGEIKALIADERKVNEERHNQLVTIILGLRDGQ